MKNYRTRIAITMSSGRVGLTDDQVRRRAASLRRVKGNTYKIISPVQFKAGEIISLPTPSKELLAHLEPLESAEEEQ